MHMKRAVLALAGLVAYSTMAFAAVSPSSDSLTLNYINKGSFVAQSYSAILNEGPTGIDVAVGQTAMTIRNGVTVTPTDYLLFSYDLGDIGLRGTNGQFYYAVGLSSNENGSGPVLSDVVTHARYNDSSNNHTYEYWGLISDDDSGTVYSADQSGVGQFLTAFFNKNPVLSPGPSFAGPSFIGSGIVTETGAAQDLTHALYSDYGVVGNYTGAQVIVISSVPEPEAYGMLLAGLGLLGFIARRRKQTTA